MRFTWRWVATVIACLVVPAPAALGQSQETLAQLRALPCPAYEVTSRKAWDDAQRAAARDRGVFRVYDRDVALEPVVDWTQAGTPSFRAHLHSFFFSDVLLQIYTREHDAVALDRALGLALDWVSANRRGAEGISPYAWNDKATGDRVPYLAYLLRIAACRDAISDDDARTLIGALEDHGRALVDDDFYSWGDNHGLYQDKGLLQLAKYTEPFLPEAADWRRHAAARFKQNLGGLVSGEDAIWLEHSIDYQMSTINLIRTIEKRTPLDDPAITRLLERMIDSAGWLVMPDRHLAQIGDTHRSPAPSWADDALLTRTGMRVFFDAGWAVVKRSDSYLIATASYHSSHHKQADELSFELYEDGQRVIVDAGKYAYDNADPHSRFAESAEAHNTLIADGTGFTWRHQQPYRSGIQAAGQAAGWYAIQARNPLLAPTGIAHRRRLLYKPGIALLVIDDVTASDQHDYTRWFHLGPGMQVVGDGRTLGLRGGGFAGNIRDWTEPATARRLVYGGMNPVQGWWYPAEREAIPTHALGYHSTGATATHVAVLALQDVPVQVASVLSDSERLSLSLWIKGQKRRLLVARDGRQLAISERLVD